MTPKLEDPGHYVLSLKRGKAWGGYGSTSLDAEGRAVRRDVPGKGETRFEPHNCEKTVGICHYAEIAPDGARTERMRINGRTGETWNYSIMDLSGGGQSLTQIGTIRYDAEGFVAEEQWTRVDGTGEGCYRRLSPSEVSNLSGGTG